LWIEEKGEQMQEKKVKPYLSQSRLSLYEQCGVKYQLRYLENKKNPSTFTQIRGTSVHAGAQQNFKHKLKKKEDLRKDDIVDIAVAAFEEELKKGYSVTAEEKSKGVKLVKSDTKDIVALMSETFALQVAPNYMPLFVEEEQRIIVQDCEYDLLARMDVCDVKENVIDIKTSKRFKSQWEVDVSEQLSFYALVYKAKTGRLPRSCKYESLTTGGQVKTLTSRRTIEDLNVILRRINMMIKGINAGVFVPCQPTDWHCSPDYCEFFSECLYVKGMTGK